jgi:transposase
MDYTGLVPSEYSSGSRRAKGGITRTGNAHLRHVLGEAARHARHRPWLNLRLKKILPKLPAGVSEIAWKAQERLHRKFTRLTFQRKPSDCHQDLPNHPFSPLIRPTYQVSAAPAER